MYQRFLPTHRGAATCGGHLDLRACPGVRGPRVAFPWRRVPAFVAPGVRGI